jgi:hypothetical protein
MKIANRDARRYVQRRQPFEGSNLYGRTFVANPSSTTEGDSGYVVFSYGRHWPLFVAVSLGGRTVWFENKDRYGTTTSRHRSQCHPYFDTTMLTVDQMLLLIYKGFTALSRERVAPIVQTEFHREVA